MAEPIKTDERDQRVRELLTLKTKGERISRLYQWAAVQGTVDEKTFRDLFKIISREAEYAEVSRDLTKLVMTQAKVSEQQHGDVKKFRVLCMQLPGLAKKLQVASSDE